MELLFNLRYWTSTMTTKHLFLQQEMNGTVATLFLRQEINGTVATLCAYAVRDCP